MKDKLIKQLMYIALVWCILILGSCGNCPLYTHNCEVREIGYSPFILDVPEEWNQLSISAQVPDTLRGYRDSSGVVHIEFYNNRNR